MNRDFGFDKFYENTAPLTLVELKKMLGKKPMNMTISEDVCNVCGIEFRDLTWGEFSLLNNAINLGIMIGKKSERKRQKETEITTLKNRVEKSVRSWNGFNQGEMEELIRELDGINSNDKRWRIKADLLKIANNIYKEKFTLKVI